MLRPWRENQAEPGAHTVSQGTTPESPSQGKVEDGVGRMSPREVWGHSPAWLRCSAGCDWAPGPWGTLGAGEQTLSPRGHHCWRALPPPRWLLAVRSAHLEGEPRPASTPHFLPSVAPITPNCLSLLTCPISVCAALRLHLHILPDPGLAASNSLKARPAFY